MAYFWKNFIQVRDIWERFSQFVYLGKNFPVGVFWEELLSWDTLGRISFAGNFGKNFPVGVFWKEYPSWDIL